jgi:hypothetical protein
MPKFEKSRPEANWLDLWFIIPFIRFNTIPSARMPSYFPFEISIELGTTMNFWISTFAIF